uniref:Putative secreted protein n=1 Tax=Panstrongylus lignarius TaxID=156445 RepID=A0A224XM83_9HEMI
MFVNLFSGIVFLTIATALNSITTVSASISPTSIQNFIGNKTEDNCVVEHYSWNCCANFSREDFHISVCILLKYLTKEYGGEMKVTVNNLVIFDEKLSLMNPPPMCIDVPYLKRIAKACIYLYDMSFDKSHLSGCAKVTGKIEFAKVFEFKVGCFDIPVYMYQDINVTIVT